VGDELRDDLVIGVREVRMGAPGHEGQAVIGEVAYQRLVASLVRGIVPGVLVNGPEPLDVIGDLAGGQAQHLRYLDEFVKQDGQWLFAERRLMVDWTDTRPSTA
jgi:hypothetical protein